MLSDFYLPSPLPPLPFHKECADVDMALLSDDFVHSSSSSSSLLLQPLFDVPPPSRSFRGGETEHHSRHASSDNNSNQPTLSNDPCMELAMALAGIDDEEGITMSPSRGHADLFENYNNNNSQPLFFSGTALDAPLSSSLSSSPPYETTYHHQQPNVQPAAAAAWMHPDCPGCLATSPSRGGAPLAGTEEATFAYSTAAALRSPGDTADGMSNSVNTNCGVADCSPRPLSSTSYPFRPVMPSPSHGPVHSWEGNGYYGPVPRTLSSSAGLDQLAFGGGDESVDGGIYGLQPLAPSFSSPHSFLNNPMTYPSYNPISSSSSSSCDLLPCADLSSSSPAAVMQGSSQPLGGASSSSASSPMATASLSSSSPMSSYYVASPYPPSASALAGSAPWFSSSPPPPVATLMPGMTPLVPLTTALPVDPRPVSGGSDCAAQKRKRAQQPPTNPGRPGSPHICTECGADKTPEWRRGPCGPRTLCNACGLRYAKRNKKKKEEELAAVTGQLAQTPSQATRKPNRSRTGSPVLGGRRSPTPGAPLQPMPQAAAAASSVLTPVVETTTITTMTPAVTSNAV